MNNENDTLLETGSGTTMYDATSYDAEMQGLVESVVFLKWNPPATL